MTKEEMIAKAEIIRDRDKFGAMTPEELSALPGTVKQLKLDCSGIAVDVYENRPSYDIPSPAPLIVNFHGGGFIKPRSDRDRRYCSYLCETTGCVVWDADYSIAPEAPFPQAVYEARGILNYAAENAEALGFDRTHIAAAGHSAGGSLVAACLILAARGEGFKPCCALMEYFPADPAVSAVEKLTDSMRADPFWVRRAGVEDEYFTFYLQEPSEIGNPLCCASNASDEELAAFPPSLVIAAGTDTLRTETLAFAKRLLDNGVPVTAQLIPEAMHGFTTNRTPGWERALALHTAFFKAALK